MRSERPASPVRGLLLFLLGGLVGANATYYLMTRNAVSPAPVASGSTIAGNQAPTQGAPPESDGADNARHQAGPMLPPPVARIHGAAVSAPAPADGTGLLLPVQGITPAQLSDTFTDARSAG